MEQEIIKELQPSGAQMPEISEGQELVKAAYLSSNPINGQPNCGNAHFEVEVENAFLRIFFGR